MTRLTEAVNDAAYKHTGKRNTCALAVAVLIRVANRLGWHAEAQEVELLIWNKPAWLEQTTGIRHAGGHTSITAGASGTGTENNGAYHVVAKVRIGSERFLSDPTIDQANVPPRPASETLPAHEGIRCFPTVLPINASFEQLAEEVYEATLDGDGNPMGDAVVGYRPAATKYHEAEPAWKDFELQRKVLKDVMADLMTDFRFRSEYVALRTEAFLNPSG